MDPLIVLNAICGIGAAIVNLAYVWHHRQSPKVELRILNAAVCAWIGLIYVGLIVGIVVPPAPMDDPLGASRLLRPATPIILVLLANDAMADWIHRSSRKAP